MRKVAIIVFDGFDCPVNTRPYVHNHGVYSQLTAFEYNDSVVGKADRKLLRNPHAVEQGESVLSLNIDGAYWLSQSPIIVNPGTLYPSSSG